MSKVCVVTGGGSGMGLSAAKFMPKDRIIVVSGRTESKLTKAVEQLREAGFEAYAKACDTSKRDSVKALAEYSTEEVGKLILKINSLPADKKASFSAEEICLMRTTINKLRNERLAKGQYTDAADDMLLKLY